MKDKSNFTSQDAEQTWKADPLKPWIEKYKLLIKGQLPNVVYDEIYKWETIQHFQDHWRDDHDEGNILEVLKTSFNKENNNLWSGGHYLPYRMLLEFTVDRPKVVSDMFHELYNEDLVLDERIRSFLATSDKLLEETRPGEAISSYQSDRAIMVYLTLRYPDRYFLYKNAMYNDFCQMTGFAPKPGRGSKNDFTIIHNYLNMCEGIREILMQDNELLDIHRSLLPVGIEFQDEYHTLTQDLIYSVTNYLKSNKSYWLFSPGENATMWEPFYAKGVMAIGWSLGDLKKLSKEDITSKLQELENSDSSKRNDATANYEFAHVISPGDIVIVKKGTKELLGYGIVESDYYYEEQNGGYNHIRNVDWQKSGSWKYPGNLAIKTLTNITQYDSDLSPGKKFYQLLLDIMNDEQVDKEILNEQKMIKLPLNQILYGPPGTGKTYATMAKAVGIAEGLTATEIKDHYPNRSDLKAQYQSHVESGRIVFTTFHQSFTYEDFVEGIKPELSEKDISYKIDDGVFKIISEEALENWELSKLNSSNIDRLPFKTAYELFKKELEESLLGDDQGILVNLQSSHFYIYDIVGDSLKMETSTGGRKNTMTSPTLEKIYVANQQDHGILSGGMKGYYNALVNKLNSYSENREIKSAQKSPLKNFVLIIDEINRGNISQIFGELITLLEKDKRLGNAESLTAKLPYSKKQFGVPLNLYIIGTMNTADRSVEALDTALRRRFAFEEIIPRPELLSEREFEDLNVEIDLSLLLQTINERIELLIDKDHKLGHSYFFSLIGSDDCERELMSIFYDKIIPLLEEYFYGDFGKIGLVLGKAFVLKKEGKKIDFAPFDMEDKSILQDKSIYSIVDYRKNNSGRDHTFKEAISAIYFSQSPVKSNEGENAGNQN